MRAIFISVSLLAFPALATGERVLLASSAEPLKDTLCVSMTCVSTGSRDASVSARLVRGGLEVTVKNGTGQVTLVTLLPRTDDGGFSTVDLVRTSSRVVLAIEAAPAVAARPRSARKPLTHAVVAHR
jgi:hypothetical protein